MLQIDNELLDDVMKEIGSMGAGNATAVLANYFNKYENVKKNLFGKNVTISPTSFRYTKCDSLSDFFDNKAYSSLFNLKFKFLGKEAKIMIFFPEHAMLQVPMLVRGKYAGKLEYTKVTYEEDMMVLKGVGQVLSTSFLNTLKKFLEINIKKAEFKFLFLPENYLQNFILAECGKNSHAIISGIDFHIFGTEFKSRLYTLIIFEEIEGITELLKKKGKEI